MIQADIGRDYRDSQDANPRIDLQPIAPTPWTDCAAMFNVALNGQTLRQPVWYAHLALLRLLKRHSFDSVLDLGSNDGMASRIFDFLGRKTTALEPAIPHQNAHDYPVRAPDIQRDFLEVRFQRQFDAIWCSHVLEHVRNPGQFLDKIFDDLREGGVLAITVPFNDFGNSLSNLVIGHHSKYNHWLLLYQLICAGFDCHAASVAVYNGQVSVVVCKVANQIPRSSTALHCPFPADPAGNVKLYEFFPVGFSSECLESGALKVNWTMPI